jgi:hypothetical protein
MKERKEGFFEVTKEGEIVSEYLNPYHGDIRKPNGVALPSSFMLAAVLLLLVSMGFLLLHMSKTGKLVTPQA